MNTQRKLTDHKVNGLNEAIEIVAGEPGSGNAPVHYTLFIADHWPLKPGVTVHVDLKFQNGPIQSPEDFNGITNEALLAVVIDRMRGFQASPYSCKENAVALTHLETGLLWLQKRTQDRMRRGVEGTLTP